MQAKSDHGTASVDGLGQVHDLSALALRHALDTKRSGNRPATEFEQDIRRMCAAARDLGLHAEDVIVMIKESWRAMSDAQTRDPDAASLLNEVVTHCISEFYHSGNDGSRH